MANIDDEMGDAILKNNFEKLHPLSSTRDELENKLNELKEHKEHKNLAVNSCLPLKKWRSSISPCAHARNRARTRAIEVTGITYKRGCDFPR